MWKAFLADEGFGGGLGTAYRNYFCSDPSWGGGEPSNDPYAIMIAGTEGSEDLILFDETLAVTSISPCTTAIDPDWGRLNVDDNGGIKKLNGWYYFPMCYDSTGSTIYRTQDFVTFEKDANPLGVTWELMAFAAESPSVVVAGDTFSRYIKSVDNGATWANTGVDLSSECRELLWDTNTSKYYAVGQSTTFRGDSIETLATWDNIGLDSVTQTLFITSSGALLMGGYAIYRSANPGTDAGFDTVLANFGNGSSNSCQYFVETGGSIYAFGTGWFASGGANTVYCVSNDDGQTWSAPIYGDSIDMTFNGDPWIFSQQPYPFIWKFTGTEWQALGFWDSAGQRRPAVFKSTDLVNFTCTNVGPLSIADFTYIFGWGG
jgi:hypothetical protein